MARGGKAKGPDQQLEELKARRVALAGKRHEFDATASAAQRVIDETPERRRAVLLVEARGETPSEAVEDVDRARQAAEIAKADALERSAALTTVEGEVGRDVDAVVDANLPHFIAKAEAASQAASEAVTAALRAAQAAGATWREAGAAWSTVRTSYHRRRIDLPPEMPAADLGGTIFELEKVQSRPFPGGSKAAWERYREREAAEQARGQRTSLTRSEVLAGFAGDR